MANPLPLCFFLFTVLLLGAAKSIHVGLRQDFYRTACPLAESTVRSAMRRIYADHKDAPPQLLRLFFHDCFIKGCDASLLLENGNGTLVEMEAAPNLTLKGITIINGIKKQLETLCPGVVSCADILALATRDGIFMTGGLYYPVKTGRRDSLSSYYHEALADIPKPSGNITETLNLFAARGFSTRETVILLGAHNVGRIGCQFFMKDRIMNFRGTGRSDPSMPSAFVRELRRKCHRSNGTTQAAPTPVKYHQEMPPVPEHASISSGEGFDGHFYKNLLRRRGVLFSDQQLMADPQAAKLVRMYASDDVYPFVRDFSRAMMKLSTFGVLTGTEGEVRTSCVSRLD